jgi:hypothetical protein
MLPQPYESELCSPLLTTVFEKFLEERIHSCLLSLMEAWSMLWRNTLLELFCERTA